MEEDVAAKYVPPKTQIYIERKDWRETAKQSMEGSSSLEELLRCMLSLIFLK